MVMSLLRLLGLACSHAKRSRVFGNASQGFYQVCWTCLRRVPATIEFPPGPMRSTLPAKDPDVGLSGLDREWLKERGIR